MNDELPDFQASLRKLAEAGVEFIVVGGVGAVLQGAPVVTFDLVLVHRRSADNVARLMSVLISIDARYRGQGERVLAPIPALLFSDGHHLLMTRYGPLDVLGTIGRGRSFEDLVSRAESVPIAPGVAVSVLTLESLIALETESGRAKDLALIPTLRRTLDEKRGG